MTELISIVTNSQGQSAVSARELHAFLEVKSKFADWIKNRIAKYRFQQGIDFKPISKNLETGGWQHDYQLSLDMAKELSMLERNEQGKQARHYFIACESRLRQLASQPLGPVQDVLLGQSQRIADLESKLSQVLTNQQQAAQALLALPRSNEPVPAETTRAQIQRIVNAYCQTTGLSQRDTWRQVYDRLYYVYRVRIRRHRKLSERESWLDVAERNGYLDKLFAIVSADLLVSP